MPPALLVSQTARAHQEIAILLEALRQARERQRLGSESAPPKDLSAESLKPIAIQPEAQRIAAERIRAMMRKPYSGHFEDVPLSKALAEVARSTGLPMYVDWDVLGYASITPDTPITCHLAGMSLSASLHVILERVGLGYAVRDEVLFVSTQDKLSNFAVAKVYPVRDLVGGRAPLDGYYLGLAQLITDFVSPTTWEGGGPPPIEGVRSAGAIVFSQTETAHQQVEVLLTALRTARDRQRSAFDKAGADENTVNESMQPITVQTDLQQATEKRIREQLEKRFSLCLNGKPNSQALSEIMRVTGVPIHLARSAIEARAPLDLSAVTLNADFSLRSQLDSIVSRANLAWTFGDECLLITTRDEAADEHILKVYPVRDLIDRPFPGEGRARFNPRLTSDEDLDLWGAAQFYREADAIAASETRAAHGRIQGFLGLVRAARRQRGEAAAAPGLPQPPIGLDQPQQSDAAKRLQTTPPAPAK
ncbi:MAG TPA: DEK C-terminal domain-containing protein [Pirellulales bacterium]|nr:DEK C-terminal domain-containing protein [Pirellulales bacterium]